MQSNFKKVFGAIIACLVLATTSTAFAADDKVTKQAKDLVMMVNAMVGTWIGDVEHYDRKKGEMGRATAEHVISTTPINSVFSIHAKFYPEDGNTKERFEVMGIRGDGAVIRMMDFSEFKQHQKSEIVLDYSMKNENDWTMTFLEKLEPLDEDWPGPILRTVHFEFSGDEFTIKKKSLIDTDRDYDLFARVKRKELDAGE